jgi:hypothetical protein
MNDLPASHRPASRCSPARTRWPARRHDTQDSPDMSTLSPLVFKRDIMSRSDCGRLLGTPGWIWLRRAATSPFCAEGDMGRPELNRLFVSRVLLDIESEAAFRVAVQHSPTKPVWTSASSGASASWWHAASAEPPSTNIEGWEEIDRRRGDRYVGARCKACGWSEGSEI